MDAGPLENPAYFKKWRDRAFIEAVGIASAILQGSGQDIDFLIPKVDVKLSYHL